MTSRAEYRHKLGQLDSWDAFLLKHSGLPGPRGNLELAQAVADVGSAQLFHRYRSQTPAVAPTNSRHEYLAFCGVLGLGRLLAEGRLELLNTVRGFASDPRWRIREAAAMALQRLGEVNMLALLKEMKAWSKGNPLERRAAAAALCEPKLLREPRHAEATLQILDAITASIADTEDRRSEDFLVMRKGLAYCWSVAVAALPGEGKRRMQKWFRTRDKDVRWIMRQNLQKARLSRIDPEWVKRWQTALADR